MSTFWIYLRLQAMMFVFGIVGPIFLFGYFAAQPDPTVRWMYWWGLFITAFDVLLALAFTRNTVEVDAKKQQVEFAQRSRAASD